MTLGQLLSNYTKKSYKDYERYSNIAMKIVTVYALTELHTQYKYTNILNCNIRDRKLASYFMYNNYDLYTLFGISSLYWLNKERNTLIAYSNEYYIL